MSKPSAPSGGKGSGLLDRVAQGDATALEVVLNVHRERLKRMVQVHLDRRLTTRLDASDVVQETLLDASRRIREFARDPAVPVHVWLRQIARDRLADLYERHLITQKRSVLREQSWGLSKGSLDRIATQFATREPSPSGRAILVELRENVHRALAAMP